MSLVFRAIGMPWLAALAWVATAASSLAAPPPAPAAAADPTQPQASVPAASHRSAFAGYRPLATVTPVPWREANDTVTRIGGWRAYAREAAQPEPAASAPTSAAPTLPASPKKPPAPTPTPTPTPEHRHGH